MISSTAGKRKRQELDLKTRFEVIQFCDANPNVGKRKVAEKFECGKTQIQSILRKREEIVKDFESNVSCKTKRCRGANHDEIDWFRKARSKNILVTGPMLQEKARQIAEALDLSQEDFKASNGRLDRFKNRNGIKAKCISGEAGGVSEDTVESWRERLPEILQGWSPENIWNMDETGQFFRALPSKSLADKSRSCTGGKRSKERLTCALFVNASGGKERSIIIGKSANPRCFRGIADKADLPCQYFNQSKAWMEAEILEEILWKLNGRLRRENRKTILFLDNAPCHPEDLDEKFTQIKIVFLPKNTTSRLQPLDLGIIQALKLKYYKRLLTHVVSKIEECSSASEVCKSVDLLQAMRWTAMAWNDVPESTVVKCFIKAGILNAEGETNAAQAPDSNDVDPFADLDDELNFVDDLVKDASGVDAASIRDTVAGHFDPPVCQELPDNWEENFFRQVAQVQQDNVESYDNTVNVSDNDDDDVRGTAVKPKLASYVLALFSLEDVLCFLETKGNSKAANELSKVIGQVESDWVERRTHQSRVTDFFPKSSS